MHRFSRWSNLLAMLLALLWVPIASHELLEMTGLIHHSGGEDHDHDHDAADGLVRLQSTTVLFKAPVLASIPWFEAFACFTLVGLFLPRLLVLAQPAATESPPGITRSWQFVRRLALPSRAPSLVS